MKILDLYCGAGGAARGYHEAGFEVVGIDVRPQPHYPFEFHRAEAIEYCARHGHEYDAIHASPPCQHYSALKAIRRFAGGREYPALIEHTRTVLKACHRPWIIENVPGSRLATHVVLCGSMFGLGAWCDGQWRQLRRHREFECSFYFLFPLYCRHVGRPVGVYGNGGAHRPRKDRPGINGFRGNAREARQAMGIGWMSRYELSQAIPPAYTRWLGGRLREHLEGLAPATR